MTDYVPFKPSNFRLGEPPVSRNLFLHARNTSNVGDLHSTPFDYFTLRGESVVGDFWSTVNAGEDLFDNIVVGGGVLARNYVRTPMYFERLRPRRNLILWGVGTDGPTLPPMPREFVERCAIIGTRDFGAASIDGERVVFCPCASAMNRAFDLQRPPPVHRAVNFLHHNHPFDRASLPPGNPTARNYGCLIDTLDFLASGEIVITNSYHGLYWATLLGRKVMCLVSGGKFAHFRWPPMYVKPEDCRDALSRADDMASYPDALNESRMLNMEFYRKVLALTASS